MARPTFEIADRLNAPADVTYYLAARFGRAAKMQEIAAKLNALEGAEVVSRWHAPDAGHGLDAQTIRAVEAGAAPRETMVGQAAAIFADVASAAVFVLFLDDGHVSGRHTQGGRYVELGIALASRLRDEADHVTVVVVGPKTNMFTWLGDREFATTPEFVAWATGRHT